MSVGSRVQTPSSAASTAFDTPLGSEPSVAGENLPTGFSVDAGSRELTPMGGNTNSEDAFWAS